MEKSISRRGVLKGAAVLSGVAAVGDALVTEARAQPKGASMLGVPFAPHKVVRVGFIGCGGRGGGLFSDLLNIDGVQIVAACDLVKERAERFSERAVKAGKAAPAIYGGTDRAFENVCLRDDIDLVYIATPWDWHVPMAVFAMEHGKHAAVEVPAATTLADCWKLVDTSEKTRKHCVQLENCNYGYNELLVLNLVRAGVLGEITHGEAAYLHDLRGLLLADSGEGLWRRFPHISRNGNLYPTHGLGPVARYMNVHGGDRFTQLVSMSSRERSLTTYRDETVPANSPKRQEVYKNGDRSVSILKTAMGKTVILQHDVVSPRPYSRLNCLQGTKGAFEDYPPRIFVEGQKGGEVWRSLDDFKAEFEHALWKKEGDTARKLGGHGGMDYLMSFRLIQCLKEGIAPEIDVYDAAAWSAPGPLSEMSIAKNSSSVEFPDFTRGAWRG